MATPKFELTLPSTGENIKFRPFLMKEEKVLLFASEADGESEVILAVDEIVRNCTFNKVSVETHPAFDLQYVFLQIRAKSVGEVAEFLLICGECDHKIDASLDLSSLEVQKDPNHTNKIKLSEDVVLTMKYPTLSDVAGLSFGNLEDAYRIVVACMDKIFVGDEVNDCSEHTVEELVEFLDNLTAEQFSLIRKFFDTMPKLSHQMEYVCPKCQKENVADLDSLLSFFD